MAQLTIGLVIDQEAVIYSSPAAPVVKQTVNPEVTGLPSGSTTEPAVELSVDDVKEAAATDAASTTPKNTKSSRRCKQKEAAKKAATAAAAAVPSSLSSGTVGEASDAVGDASEAFQGLASPVKELQQIREEAGQARKADTLTSSPPSESVQDNAPDAEDLQQPEIKVDEIESLAVPTSVPADATQTAAATAAEVRPATVPESKDVISVRSRGQRSIMDFFKKGPVVMVQEVSSTLTHESVTSPAESVEAITFEAPEYIDSSEVEEEVIGAVNAGDYHDCQPGTSGEDALSDGVSAICEGPTVVEEVEEPVTNADALIATAAAVASKPSYSGRANRVSKRTTAESIGSYQDTQQITVALAQETVTKTEVQDSSHSDRRWMHSWPRSLKQYLTAISWVKKADDEQKAAVNAQFLP
ncbi:hypothetical protein N0V91_010335 [Didymella pomorum]|uniref:Uncharacterized protein n=1 Tax=Didymella pomorum TaxID=749634 RepID=A0A9W8Z5W2_9PLEO|nr:hypothetical protein N0V91_010335 [Didymella pomorum]